MLTARGHSPGALLAAALAGAWRTSPPTFTISSEELDKITPLLLGSGAAALGWWRVRHCELSNSPCALLLRETYHCSAVRGVMHEHEIKRVFAILRSAGVEPILIKGWAVARIYPETGLRPSGDIDLCVAPEQWALAESILKTPEGKRYLVDLVHEEVTRLGDQSFDQLYDRSQLVDLDGYPVRVPGAEDHLRILCLHFLKHGAYRPLWLCDIGVALESRSVDFNWNLCLGKDRRRAHWIVCALGLAHLLLDARIEGTPVVERAKHLPSWLLPRVLKRWNDPYPIHLPLMIDQIALCWFRPTEMLRSLVDRWPNPIEATMRLKGPFNEVPRLPYQVANCLWRAARLAPQLWSLRQRQAKQLSESNSVS